jgi:hypothetical protein
MDKLRDHVNSVGTDAALKALGEEATGKGESVQYAGWAELGDFAEKYLDRNGITLVHGNDFEPGKKLVATVSPETGKKPETTAHLQPRNQAGDIVPVDQQLRDKLHEAQHLPGLEKSEDLAVLMGGELGGETTHFTPDVLKKLDETYGKGQWIVKSYGPEAFAGFGIFFPQRAAQIQQDARNTIWSAGEQVARHGFTLERDAAGKVNGLKHQGGESYPFGSEKYASTIHGDVRRWGDLVGSSRKVLNADGDEIELGPAADSEHATQLPIAGRQFMAQPAFPVVGISDAERAAGITFKKGQEGRTHIVTRNGKAELVPHSTWLKKEHLPVVFESADTKAMAQAALDAINALPESERQGQLYAPDIVPTANGYKVVEANPADETGASGYLQDNPFIIDSYVSHLTGREPAHVQFIRNLLTKKSRT